MGRMMTVLAATAAFGLAGCGSGGDPPAVASARERPLVVTTVAPITSIVAEVVGDAADVVGVVPEGVNSHTFEPAPSAAEVLSKADVVFVNGLRLEDPTQELAERNRREGARIVALGDAVLAPKDYLYDFSFPREAGKPNPHLWTDPTYARRYAEVVRDTMTELDPDDADAYRSNFDAFAARIDGFDGALRAATATVPEARRKLLTYHDAYAYFARSYGWTIIGAIQVESFDDPSPRDIARLIEQVRAEQVPAIFGSEVFPSRVLETIGEEAGVTYVDVLRDDDLPGRPGEDEHSWLGLIRFDYATIVEALGGDPSGLRNFDIATPAPDRAEYPQ